MTAEIILNFFFKYNTILIEGMVVLILLTASFLTFRSFKQMRDESTGATSATDMSHIEESLKKILERAGNVPASTGASGEASPELIQEISFLKNELQKKQKEIEEAKSAVASAPVVDAGMSGEEKSQLESKINDLQQKLSEFDIISQDIADLTMYREENIKLKEELENLKKAPPPAAAAPAPAPASAAPEPETAATQAPAPAADPMDDLFNPTTAVAEPAPSPAADPMDDLFNPTSVEAAPAAVAPAPEPAAPSAAPATAAAPDSSSIVDDDLMAEFAAALAEQEGAAPPPAAAPVMPAVTEQDKELMGQFESFVSKDKK